MEFNNETLRGYLDMMPLTQKGVMLDKVDEGISTRSNISPSVSISTNTPEQSFEIENAVATTNKEREGLVSVKDVLTSSYGITDYDKLIFKEEGGQKTGNVYMPYTSLEGGLPTIAHGHKVTEEEAKTGVIHGINFSKGVTSSKALEIYLKDKDIALKVNNIKNMSEDREYLALDVAHRAGNIKNWGFLKTLKDPKKGLGEAFRKLGDVGWIDSEGNKRYYDKRNKQIFESVGYIPTAEDWREYRKLQDKSLSSYTKKRKSKEG